MPSSNWVFGNLDDLRTCYQSDTRIDKNLYQLKSLYLHTLDSQRRLIIDHTSNPLNVGSISGYAIEHIYRTNQLKEYKPYLMPIVPRDVTVNLKRKKMMFKSPPWYKFWRQPEHTIQIDRIYGNPPVKVNYMLSYPFYDHVANRLCWVMPFSPYCE